MASLFSAHVFKMEDGEVIEDGGGTITVVAESVFDATSKIKECVYKMNDYRAGVQYEIDSEPKKCVGIFNEDTKAIYQ